MPSTKTFQRTLQEIEHLIQKKVPVQALSTNYSPFEHLSAEQQKIIAHYANTWLKILKEMCKKRENWLDSCKSLKAACKQLNIQADEAIFDLIDSDDIIEIYTASGLQVFRSFNLFLRSNFSIETMLCCPWDQLTERDPQITQTLWATLQNLLQQGITQTLPWKVPVHTFNEILGGRKYPFRLELKYVSVFSKDGIAQGIISTGALQRISSSDLAFPSKK